MQTTCGAENEAQTNAGSAKLNGKILETANETANEKMKKKKPRRIEVE
jgi:hypothetical protein